MKLKFERKKESYRAQKNREFTERILKNEQAKEFGTDEVEAAPTPSRFWRPIQWVINIIMAVYWRFKSNLYASMDESVEIYEISVYDIKRLNFRGVDVRQFNGVIILHTMPIMIRKYIAVLNWKGSKADKAKQAHDILNIAATSTYLTVPPLTIAALRALADAYGNSSVGGEQTAWSNLNNGMLAMMYLFQNYGNANQSVAELAIKSGGFSVKKVTPRGKQPWSVANNPVGGVLDLTANGVRGNAFHDWWISYDGKTFTRLYPTTAAHTQVTGLASNIEVYFMHQIITKDGPQGFDSVLKIGVA